MHDRYTAHIATIISGIGAFFARITLNDIQPWLTALATCVSVLCGILGATLYCIKIYKSLQK